jgi:hypothetical protein
VGSLAEAAAVLGLGGDRSPAAIRQAFAARVRQVHPDLQGPSPEAGRDLARLVAARDLLLDAATGSGRSASREAVAPGGRGERLRRALIRFLVTWRTYEAPRTPPR